MKKLTYLMPTVMCFFLASCGTPSVEELANDPDKLQKVMQKCEKLEAEGKNILEDEACKNAAEAMVQAAKNKAEGLVKDLFK